MGEFIAILQHYREWVYPLTIAGTFLEGETFVLFTAAAATTLQLDPLRLGLCAWFGSAVGDQCWFFAGRFYGPWVLNRWSSARAGIAIAHRWLERWDTMFILTYRFMYGIRNVSSIALGLSKVKSIRFIVLNMIAAGIWSVTFVGAGVLFGRAAGDLLGHWATTIELSLASIFLLAIVGAGLMDRDRRARLVAWSRRR